MTSPPFHLCLLAGMCISSAFTQEEKPASTPPKSESSKTQFQRTQTPQPSPEMQTLLSALSGTWSMTVEYESSESRPKGDLGRGEVVFHPGPGGLSLIEDEHSKNATGEMFGLSVTWWDENAKGFRAVWCDNSLPTGCIVMSKLANWEGDRFVLGDEFERNGKKYTFKEIVFDITANTYTQALYQGESGSELRQLLTIRATKVPAVTSPVSKSAQQLSTLNMPGPKVQNLMLGTWSIKIKDEPSKEMPQGGTGEGTQVWRPGPGGRSIIEEEHWRNPPGEFDGFSVGWWDAKAEGQRFVWCANDVPEGCVVPKNVAKWEGERLVFTEEREEAGKKITHGEIFSDIAPNSFTQILQEGEPGHELKPTVTIRATRVMEPFLKPTSTSSPEAELHAAMAERLKASIEGDTEKIESLTADEYVQTDIFGYVQDKSAWLNEYFRPLAGLIKAGKFRWEVYDERDVRIRMLGDTAVVIGSMTLKGTGAKPAGHTWEAAPQSSVGANLRFTRVWINRNGRWFLAAVHNARLLEQGNK